MTQNTRLVEWADDFIGAAINPAWNLVKGTDTATISFTVNTTTDSLFGKARLRSGDTGTGLAADMGVLNHGSRQWMVHNPVSANLAAEFRLALKAVTNVYLFVGFTDDVILEAPIMSASSGDSVTANATDAFGVMFDTRMATDNWWGVGVSGGALATPANLGSAPIVNRFNVIRVEADILGQMTVFLNDVRVAVLQNSATYGVALTPVIAWGKTSGASTADLDIDKVWLRAYRPGPNSSTNS